MRKRNGIAFLLVLLLFLSSVPCYTVRADAPQTVQNNGYYQMADLNQMSNRDLIHVLSSLDGQDHITDLFDANEAAYTFYGNVERMDAVFEAMDEKASTYTPEDNLGLPVLMEVVRAGFYLASYHNDLAVMDTTQQRNKCVTFLNILKTNPSFGFGTTDQDIVVDRAGLLTSATFVDKSIVNSFGIILQDYVDHFQTYQSSYYKSTAFFDIMNCIDYSLNTRLYSTTQARQDSSVYGQIDSFIRPILFISNKPLDSKSQNSISNALYFAGRFIDYSTSPQQVNIAMTNAMEQYPKMEYEYFQAASIINDHFQGINSHGSQIHYDQLLTDATDYLFPHTYAFEDGDMVIHTGSQVSYDKVQRLYWASHEVRARFFRCFGTDQALEKNHPDDVLEMYIFNSPQQYKVNSFINGLNTNNGGIYIESQGRFYTYERTSSDSIFSVEELFRHEYTHFLQGRYLIPGMWGSSDIYQNERVTWFEEGGAEFFAGSTRTQGILPRYSIINYLDSTQQNRYSLKDTLYSTYDSGFTFYNYAAVLNDYLYHEHFTDFQQFASSIRQNNVSEYDSIRQSLAQNIEENNQFQLFMQGRYQSRNELTTPLVSDDYLQPITSIPRNEVIQAITDAASLTNVTCKISKSNYIRNFTVSGTYVGSDSKGYEADWKAMDQRTDQILKSLSQKEWNGYKTLTGYFVNYKVNIEGNYQFDVVYSGAASDQQGNLILTQDATTAEKEPNNTLANAQLIPAKTVLTGGFTQKDSLDYYKINVEQQQSLTIDLKEATGAGVTWVLYSADNHYQYIGYSIGVNQPVTKTLNPGSYILLVYKTSGNTGSYQIQLK